ncbi:PAS domain S-box protein [bacterium]|nr:PAS domain S-box protein [bacterium]
MDDLAGLSREELIAEIQRYRVLSADQTQFNRLCENAMLGILILSEERVLYANPRFAEMIRQPVNDVQGWTRAQLFDVILATDRQGVERAWQALMGSQNSLPAEFRILTDTGEQRWLRAVARLIEFTGQPAILVNLVDISTLKETQRRLEQRESDLARAQQMARLGSFRADLRTGQVTPSPEAKLITGLDDATPTLLEFEALIHPEDLPNVQAKHQRAERSDGRFDEFFRILRADGSVRYLHELSQITFDSAGQPASLFGLVHDITEQYELKQRISEAEARYKSVVDSSPMGIHLYHLQDNGQLVFTGANATANRLLGIDHAPLVGKSIEEAFPPLAGTEIPGAYRNVANTGESWQTQQINYEDNKIQGAFEVYAFSISPRKIAVMFWDITEQLRARQALQDNEEYLRALSDATSEAIFISEGGICIGLNKTAERMFGAQPEEFLGRPLTDWVAPESRQQVSRNIREGTTEPYKLILQKKDGETFPGIVQGRMMTYRGKLSRISILQNITEREAAERKIKESERRYRSFVENFPGIAYRSSLDFLPVFMHGQVTEITGFTEQELAAEGSSLENLIYEDDFRGQFRFQQQQLKREPGYAIEREYRIVTKDQEIRWIHENVRNVVDDSGQPAYVEGVIFDITDRKQVEDQLRQAQKMEALGVLAGGIAHDFNNILFAILGNADLIRDTLPDDDMAQACLEAIISSASRASDLVKQILTFARRTERSRQEINIVPLVKEVSKLMKSTQPSNINIVTEILCTQAPVVADPTEIHQLLMNLCTNAGYAMREHGGRLSIFLRPWRGPVEEPLPEELAAEHYFVLEVSDTGIGIPEEIRGQVFDPFFTTKAVGEGTGMGLAVVHSVVEELQGWVDMTSTVGRGTSFRIILPMADADEQPESAGELSAPRGVERVLVVDDEPVIVDVLKQTLANLGYQVTGFTSSVQALEHFMQDIAHYDAAILDQTMPNLTGAEIAQLILIARPEFPIIIATGFSHTLTEANAQAIGIRRYLEKPVDTRVLAKHLREVLDEQKATAKPASAAGAGAG